MRKSKRVSDKYLKYANFSPRGSKCPICKKNFRYGCNHSIAEAEEKLFRDYIKEIVN